MVEFFDVNAIFSTHTLSILVQKLYFLKILSDYFRVVNGKQEYETHFYYINN